MLCLPFGKLGGFLAGALGSHVVERPAPGAFDLQIGCFSFSQQAATAASDFFFHFSCITSAQMITPFPA